MGHTQPVEKKLIEFMRWCRIFLDQVTKRNKVGYGCWQRWGVFHLFYLIQVHAANAEAMRRLDDYHQRYGQLMAEFFPSKRKTIYRRSTDLEKNPIPIDFYWNPLGGGGDAARMPPLADVLSELRAELAATAAGKIQNVAVLRLAETAVRRMKGEPIRRRRRR